MDGEAMKYGIIEFGESLNSERWNVEAKILVLDDPSSMATWADLEGFFKTRDYTMGDPQKIPVQFLMWYARTMWDTQDSLTTIPYAICQTEPWKVHWRLRVDCSQNPPKLTP
jgi:hypothetical protein